MRTCWALAGPPLDEGAGLGLGVGGLGSELLLMPGGRELLLVDDEDRLELLELLLLEELGGIGCAFIIRLMRFPSSSASPYLSGKNSMTMSELDGTSN